MANAVYVELYLARVDPPSEPVRHTVLPLPRESITSMFLDRWKEVLEEEYPNTEWSIYTSGPVEMTKTGRKNGGNVVARITDSSVIE